MRIIGALYGSGGRTNGAEEGAKVLFELAKLFPLCQDAFKLVGPNSCDTNLVTPFMLDLKSRVKESHDKSEFTLILGGDHSISMASISAVCENPKYNTGVIYLDAHADMNTFETTPSGNIHGMPLAVCLGMENSFSEVNKVPLKKENLLLLGTRSVDEGERMLMDDLNICSYSSDYLNDHDKQEIDAIIQDFITTNNLSNIHLSFDIDVIDPKYAPGTGVPEPNGINELKAHTIIEKVFKTGIVRSMDIVEYNPKLDSKNQTLDICKNIIEFVKNRLCQYGKCLLN